MENSRKINFFKQTYFLIEFIAKDHNQALMDIGALICTDKNPNCSMCPFKQNCYAYNLDCINEIPGKKEKKEKKS
jgi:adenine-specific DNA glycosylase